MILLVADMQDLRPIPARPAMATVLEAKLDRGRGPVATVLVRNGTLHVGDYFICGSVFGKVRAMYDDRGDSVTEAGPSMPVEVLGLEVAARSRRHLPGRHRYRQGQADRHVPRGEGARSWPWPRPPASRSSSSTSSCRKARSRNCNVILKTDVGGSAEVLDRHAAEALQRQGRDPRDCTPAWAPSTKPTCCWLRPRTPS